MEYLTKDELEVGQLYEVNGRNLGIGLWEKTDGWKEYSFVYLRTKFGQEFIDTEYHYDDGAPFGTAKPIKKFEGEVDWIELAEKYLGRKINRKPTRHE